MQRWPAVPTAPKTTAGITTSKSAFCVTIMALFPPNSNKLLPNRAATACPTDLPIRVEPVAETNATFVSFESHSPTFLSPMIKQETPSGIAFLCKTSWIIF